MYYCYNCTANLPFQSLFGQWNAGFAGDGLLDLGDANGPLQGKTYAGDFH